MARRRGKRWTASGYDKAMGRKKHLGTFDTQREALNVEADWRLRTRATGRETCNEFAERWMRDFPRERESTRRTNSEHVRRFSKDFEGVKLGDVDRPAARTWALKHRSDLTTVRAMFGDALRDGLIDYNPFAELRIARGRGRRDIIALTEAELKALADHALDARMELGEFAPEYRAMILFAGYVGLRPGELFALRRDEVDGQFATIERSYSSHSHETGPTKNGRARTVIVPPAAQDALLEVPAHPSGLLFVTPTDKQWTASLHHRYWTRLRLIANRPGFDFYELRHAAATMLLERGVTPWDVALQLGHTDGGKLVMSTYGHPAEAGVRARLIAAWDAQTGPTPIDGSGARREQAS
jgi:integrase